jgi:hypothetical protein
VNIPSLNPDTLGVYAGTNGGNNVSLVIVNKDPNNPVALNLSGIPNGVYFLRHFGGKAGIAKYQVCAGVQSPQSNWKLTNLSVDHDLSCINELHCRSILYSSVSTRINSCLYVSQCHYDKPRMHSHSYMLDQPEVCIARRTIEDDGSASFLVHNLGS